ncbi:MAG: hypothetical protein R2709_09145 [Marmoricola sp.]
MLATNIATSINDEAKKEYSGLVGMKIVSTCAREEFICAICNSGSKSLTAAVAP